MTDEINMDQVREFIMAADKGTLDQIFNMTKIAWRNIDAMAVTNFKKGDEVTWQHKGLIKTGIVEKINQKTVSLHLKDQANHKWRVSGTLLKKV